MITANPTFDPTVADIVEGGRHDGGLGPKGTLMALDDDDITTSGAGGEGPADGGSNPGGHDGGADGTAGAGEGPADGGSNPDGHDGGADGTA